MGSAVDKTNLTHQLEMFKQAGLGGVEICPIYGVQGYEDRFIDFLSPQWMEMFAHTMSEAKRLGLEVDLTTGTGWPFGGPRVPEVETSGRINLERYDVAGGTAFAGKLPDGQLQTIHAYSDDGKELELLDKVQNSNLVWTAPPGNWHLYAVAEGHQVQMVKRAAPGAVGFVLDPFSPGAMDHYLADFDQHFAVYHGAMPRAEFHDSYEYYFAAWTPALFPEFASRRGYDLHAQLPALFGDGPDDTVARVRTDFRETLADLHLAYIQHWTAWNHGHGSLSRNQAHGSPANLIDVYAASDIPETEMMPFGGMGATNYPMNKFSSSAAHLWGKPLASSESFTWLTDHFQAPLSLVKQAADYLFLTGVNHILFHGIPYSPESAAWPGWQFYAAVNFGPYGGLWHDLPEFNAYVTRCQSVLQSGASANDVLLYYNIYDQWETPTTNAAGLIIGNPLPATCKEAALDLLNHGYAFDYVSDRALEQTDLEEPCPPMVTTNHGPWSLNGVIYSPRVATWMMQRQRGGSWGINAIVVPSCHLMPEASLERLIDLVRHGVKVFFVKNLPGDVPGLGNLDSRRAKFKSLISQIKLEKTGDPAVQKAVLGAGAIFVGPDADALLKHSDAMREPMMDDGLWFVRRCTGDGYVYFIVNRSDKPVDGWITLGSTNVSGVLVDPLDDHPEDVANHPGKVAALRKSATGATQVYLQILPGESRILQTLEISHFPDIPGNLAWPYAEPAGAPQEITGSWDVKFVEGGPALPGAFSTTKLVSWTTRDDPEAQRFAGTARYTITFDHPADNADDWILKLGRVGDAARVKLNGHDVGAVWCAPWQISVGRFLQPGQNVLEVEVTNIAANRVRDLDLRQVKWKYFYDVNMNAKAGGHFDASPWSLRDSGLLGPVQLQPVKKMAGL
jgi:hypothetical protein